MEFTLQFTFLLLIAGCCCKLVLGTAKLADVTAKCESGENECDYGPYCFGFSDKEDHEDNNCSEVKNFGKEDLGCTMFASVKKEDNDFFTVILVGKKSKTGTPWVGIAFSTDKQIMKKDNVAVVCVAGSNNVVKVFNLQDRPATTEKIDITEAKNQASIKDGSVETQNDYIVCEFKLSAKPKADGSKAFDLVKDDYYIGLARHGDDGASSKLPKLDYHGGNRMFRGSSGQKQDFFKLLKAKESSVGTSVKAAGFMLWLSVITGLMYFH